MTVSPHRARDDGMTLIELLVTVVIMGVAFVTILSAIAVFHRSTVTHRASADLDHVARTYVEMLGGAGYVDCATSASYGSIAVPSGFTVSGTTVRYWNGAPGGSNFVTTCPITDNGVQQLTVTLTKDANQQRTVLTIVKRKP